ncbi:nitrate/nitrite transporter NrtS [Catenovulum maritimum]|uniref:Phosphoenolpyruvate protein kinase n=1 Tax=Catenovulum maritimum TaxID=1513271 RepID=A0A0J8JL76_9ALTE|nr:nitrate/nitrite transporter NrtS [Catenovulum maritimum]KMT65311.1 hypothetical protein XM47_09765 [Catenovulum maritimum]
MSIKTWLAVASDKQIVTRSLKISLIVGSLLTLINQYEIFIGETQITTAQFLKIVLTYMVPYAVSTYAAVSTKLNK